MYNFNFNNKGSFTGHVSHVVLQIKAFRFWYWTWLIITPVGTCGIERKYDTTESFYLQGNRYSNMAWHVQNNAGSGLVAPAAPKASTPTAATGAGTTAGLTTPRSPTTTTSASKFSAPTASVSRAPRRPARRTTSPKATVPPRPSRPSSSLSPTPASTCA